VSVVVLLEDTVVGHDPADVLGHEGLQDRIHHLAVSVGREHVADIVEECRHYVLLAAAVTVGPRRGLQRVLLAGDLVTAERLVEGLDRFEQPVGERPQQRLLVPGEDLVVLARRLVHAAEGDGFHVATLLPVTYSVDGHRSLPLRRCQV
jgi:hypothetical protein